MRFFAAFLALVFFSPATSVLADTIKVASRIDKVTVFPSGAAVVRIAKVKLGKGEHVIVIGDLPGQAVASSIRVEGRQVTGNLSIGSVDSRRLMVTKAEAGGDAERKRLEDAIEAAKDNRAAIVAEIETAQTKKQLISNLANLPNHPAPSQGSVGVAPDWSGLLSLISSEMAGVQREVLDGQKRLRESDLEIKDLQKQLAATTPKRIQRTEVKIFAEADTPLEATLMISYQVSSASWVALYDARLTTGSKTQVPELNLTRRASITQRTGEDWKGVGLSLSTTRPHAGASAPTLPVLTVDFERPPQPRPVAMEAPEFDVQDEMAGQARSTRVDKRRYAAQAKRRRKVAAVERVAVVADAPFQALFSVPGAVDVPATGAAKKVKLAEDVLKPKLNIRTVPARQAKAYLYAELTVPKGVPLLPGQVSLFRDGTFVGNSRLPLVAPQEKHKVGFGVDDLVTVRYAVEGDKRGETGLISTARTDDRNYKMSIKNLHERAIDITVIDRMPVSKNDDIKVNLIGPTAPTEQGVKDKRGILAWESTLGPDEEEVIKFGYQVVWPAEKAIQYSP